jgi:hypothetical protein
VTDTTLADFAKKLVPQPYDKTTASQRRSVIEEKVKSKLNSSGLVESGSWSHGTAVAGNSDVDYMAYFTSYARPVSPSTALVNMKVALGEIGRPIQNLRISSPTVKVEFWSAPHFEVVPAYLKEDKAGVYIWHIPGPGDEWVESIPQAHNGYVSLVNDKHSKKVKTLIRLVKAWKYRTGAPVSSFYLEMRTAQHANGESVIIYDMDLRWLFQKLVDSGMRQMNDPLGIVPRITATSSEANRVTALRMARSALDSLRKADAAKDAGDRGEYWSAMVDVFGYDYPWPSW